MTIIIVPTEQCNFRCTGCFEPNAVHEGVGIKYSFNGIKNSLMKIWDGPYRGSDVCLHGGEPLLTPLPELEKLMSLIYNLPWGNGKVKGSVSIVTNGSLITDKHIELFKKYNVHVGLSCDGPPELNIHRGPDPRNDVVTKLYNLDTKKLIVKLRKSGVNLAVMCIMHKENSSTPELLKKLGGWLLWLKKQGITGGRLNPMYSNRHPELELTNKQLYWAWRNIYQWNKKYGLQWNPVIEMEKNLKRDKGGQEYFSPKPCVNNRCSPFNTHTLSILPDGTIGCCLVRDSMVLMSDFTWKPIQEIELGERLLTFQTEQTDSQYRKLVETEVTYKFKRKSSTVTIITDKGKIQCSPDHPFMARKYWGVYRFIEAKNLFPGMYIKYYAHPEKTICNDDFKIGYISGLMDGDGSIKYAKTHREDKRNIQMVRIALKDKDILKRAQEYLLHFNIKTSFSKFKSNGFSEKTEMWMIYSYKQEESNKIFDLMKRGLNTESYKRGYVSGFWDAEGSGSNGQITFWNTDYSVMEIVSKYLNDMNFTHSIIRTPDDRYKNKEEIRICITGGSTKHFRFMSIINPACKRKRDGLLHKTPVERATIIEIEDSGIEDVYNIETSEHTYIAEGFMNHNCDRTFDRGLYVRSADQSKCGRYEALEQLDCKGCRYWDICGGGCPEEGLGGDWRRRTRFCEAIFDIYGYIANQEGIDFFPSEHTVTLMENTPHGDDAHGDVPHGDSTHGNNTHGNAPHGDAPHGDSTHGDSPDYI